MEAKIARRRKVAKFLGPEGTAALAHCLNSVQRILPHAEVSSVRFEGFSRASVAWASSQRTQLRLRFSVGATKGFSVVCVVRRKAVPSGVGAIVRTIDSRERLVCESIVRLAASFFCLDSPPTSSAIIAVPALFDELVVADYLKQRHHLKLDVFEFMGSLRHLAEQTYENSAFTFGCIIDTADQTYPQAGTAFPAAFFELKRYRALSDAYYTSYMVSSAGKLLSFMNLYAGLGQTTAKHYYPEWCAQFAEQAQSGRVGLALNRQGEILLIEDGTLRFSYRFGKWQYWNHSHLIDLAKNLIRTQHVQVGVVAKVANAIYRAALDVSFRRSGGLFVVLRNTGYLKHLAKVADVIDNPHRSQVNAAFDHALPATNIMTIPRTILLELSSLDGAIVCSNSGELLAYGAVLEPTKKGRPSAAEGSRTKAAIGSSMYGLALKISSDGEISMYRRGERFLRV